MKIYDILQQLVGYELLTMDACAATMSVFIKKSSFKNVLHLIKSRDKRHLVDEYGHHKS